MRRPVLIHGRLADAPPEGPARPQLTTPASRPVTLIAADEYVRPGSCGEYDARAAVGYRALSAIGLRPAYSGY